MYQVNEMKQVIELLPLIACTFCIQPRHLISLGTLYICIMYICRKVVGTSPPVKQCEIRLLVQVHMVAADIGKAI